MWRLSYFSLLFFSTNFILNLSSCSKPTGCVDSRALNYDPNAEVANASCVYPSLELVFDLKLGSAPFEINRIYTINGHNTAFKEMQFYISDLQLTRSDQSIANYDSLYPLVKEKQSTFALGEVYLETYEQLRFNLGISPTSNSQIASYLNNPNHPLHLQTPDTMHFNNYNEGYIFLKMVGKVDRNGDGIPNENEPFDFRIGSDALLQTINLAINKTVTLANDKIIVELDVEKLLHNVDLQTEQRSHTLDNLPLASKIANNIPNSLRIP